MNRNFSQKRKCPPRRNGSSLFAAQRMEGKLERAPHPETPAKSGPQKQGAVKRRVILLLSRDLGFDIRLRMAALERGQIVIRVESVEAALRIVHTECSGVILLDLDFAGKTTWELAGSLMQEALCPPIILLTGQEDQYGLRMAIMAGSIFEKSANAGAIVNMLNEVMEAPPSEKVRHFTAQLGMIRRLTASNDPTPLIPGYRFWGINE